MLGMLGMQVLYLLLHIEDIYFDGGHHGNGLTVFTMVLWVDIVDFFLKSLDVQILIIHNLYFFLLRFHRVHFTVVFYLLLYFSLKFLYFFHVLAFCFFPLPHLLLLLSCNFFITILLVLKLLYQIDIFFLSLVEYLYHIFRLQIYNESQLIFNRWHIGPLLCHEKDFLLQECLRSIFIVVSLWVFKACNKISIFMD